MTQANENTSAIQQNNESPLTNRASVEGQNEYFAQPYNPDAIGFYFSTYEEFQSKSESLVDHYNNPVEEFEIQFIDGEDGELFKACSINQSNIEGFITACEELQDYEKVSLFYLCSNNGYFFEDGLRRMDEVCIQEGELKDIAEELFDELYSGDIPENIRFYIDYEKFARDAEIGGDMTEFEFNNVTYTCTNSNCL